MGHSPLPIRTFLLLYAAKNIRPMRVEASGKHWSGQSENQENKL